MSIRGLLHRLRVLISPESYAREIEAEMRFHRDLEAMQQRATGVAPDEAEFAARRRFGNPTVQRDEVLRVSGVEIVDRVKQDALYALRGIRRAPGFAAAITLTLALAIGANSAVFSVIDPLLFRPPPGVVDPNSVRRLYHNHPNSVAAVDGRAVSSRFSYPEFLSIRAELAGMAHVAAYSQRDSIFVRHGGDSLVAGVTYATADYLSLLGTRPTGGRLLVSDDDDVNAPAPVAVVGARFANRVFGDADPLGQSIAVGAKSYTIVGVLDAGFEGIDWSASDVWVPFSTLPRFGDGRRQPWYATNDRYIPLIARLRADVDDRTINTRASLAYVRAFQTTSKSEQGRLVLVGPIVEARGPASTPQEVTISKALAGVAVILLLIACANVANLLLARAILRRREIAVRLTLGISRARLASQLIVESLVLACIAGIAAVLAATWVGRALRVTILPRIQWIGPDVGPRVLAFTIATTVGAGLLAAIIPSILASRLDLTDALKGGARDGIPPRARVRSGLLVVQAALSVMLLVGAALFAKSLRNVHAVDLGLDNHRLVIAGVNFFDQKAHREMAVQLPQFAERIRAIPGVAGVAYGQGAPFNSRMSGVDLFTAGGDSTITSEGRTADYLSVSADYFPVVGTRIIRGRGFLDSDQRDALPVMVVSETMATTFWPGENPIGRCVIPDARKNPCHMIVGVAEDAHLSRIIEKRAIVFYLPITQVRWTPTSLVVRVGSGDPTAIAQIVRGELARAFPTATSTARAVDDIIAREVRPWKIGAQLFSALSLLALAVAAIGIYSVVAFHTRQRTHEMGVRIALGARSSDLVRLVVRSGAGVIAVGIGLGVVGALAGGKFVASLLYGVAPRDPTAMAIAAFMLLAVGILASVGPAWRASRVDPAAVLRDE